MVRIAVAIPPGDDRLISWRDFADLHEMPYVDYLILDQLGDYGAPDWWIYRGTIPVKWFADVDFLDDGKLTRTERRMVMEAEASASYEEMKSRLGIIEERGHTLIPNEYL